MSLTHRQSKTLLRATVQNIALAFVVTALCMAALEWLLRTYVFDPNAAYIRTPGLGIQVRTAGIPPEKVEDHIFTVNRLGLRGDAPGFLASPRIAVLGGSTVEDWPLSDNNTWPQRLANDLRPCEPDVWVANLGKSGVNARHHLLQLPAIEPYMPRFDMFVVLMGLNDFLYDLHIDHPIETPAGWSQRQAFQSSPGAEGRVALATLFDRLTKRGTGGGPVSEFGAYMQTLWAAHAKVRSEQWINETPDLSKHLATYRSTIRSLKAYADAYGAPIVFVTQPSVWSDPSEEAKAQIYAGFIGPDPTGADTRWYTPEAMSKGLGAYNRTLLDVCHTDGLSCIDAAAKVTKARYFYDDFHFSKAGAVEMGAIVSAGLRLRCKA